MKSGEPGESGDGLKRVFIVGFPRSGTTFTMWLLAQLPNVVTLQQSGLFHALDDFEDWWNKDHFFSGGPETPNAEELKARRRPRRQRGTKPRFLEEKWKKPSQAGDREFIGTTAVLTEDSYYELLRPMIDHVFERIAEVTPGTRVVVEQTPENLEYQETVHAVFPDAYFLHVRRDPRDAICSMRRAARSTVWDNKFPGRPIHISGRWLDYEAQADRLREDARHYREVRYEDLTTNGAEELRGICEWLGIDVDLATCERAVEACRFDRVKDQSIMPKAFFRKGGAGAWREDLSGSELRSVEYLLGAHMDRLGYERHFPSTTAEPFGIRRLRLESKLFGRIRWWSLFLTRRLRKWFELRFRELRYTDVKGTEPR